MQKKKKNKHNLIQNYLINNEGFKEWCEKI